MNSEASCWWFLNGHTQEYDPDCTHPNVAQWTATGGTTTCGPDCLGYVDRDRVSKAQFEEIAQAIVEAEECAEHRR